MNVARWREEGGADQVILKTSRPRAHAEVIRWKWEYHEYFYDEGLGVYSSECDIPFLVQALWNFVVIL